MREEIHHKSIRTFSAPLPLPPSDLRRVNRISVSLRKSREVDPDSFFRSPKGMVKVFHRPSVEAKLVNFLLKRVPLTSRTLNSKSLVAAEPSGFFPVSLYFNRNSYL